MHKYILFIFTMSFCWTNDQIFIACEGNYYENEGSLWIISEEDAYDYTDNPIGNVVQTLLVHGNKLYVIVNGSSNIQVFNINEEGLSPVNFIDTNDSGPREMLIYENFLYFTNWLSSDVKKINLNTLVIEEEIPTPGLPEDIIIHNGLLYVSITMNHDWTDGSQVITIDPNIDSIIDSFEVGLGPGKLLEHEGEIYVSRTYYDANWNAYYGTSKIKQDGYISIVNYGSGSACGGGIYTFQNAVYRIYNGGIAMLDEDLNIIPESRLGNYNFWEVYSAEIIGENIYFGLSDYIAPDEVAVVNADGEEISRYEVGALPGDFATWSSCLIDGDINSDLSLSILDIVLIVNYIIFDLYDCSADMNEDNNLDVLDIIILIDLILT